MKQIYKLSAFRSTTVNSRPPMCILDG